MSIVDNIQILKSLSEEEKQKLALFCQEKFLKKWEVLFEDKQEATAMYLLVKWDIEISKVVNWEEKVLWEVHAEEILWEMALFWGNNKRMAKATALNDCTLVVILSFSVKELIDKYPEIYDKIKDIISHRSSKNKNIMK